VQVATQRLPGTRTLGNVLISFGVLAGELGALALLLSTVPIRPATVLLIGAIVLTELSRLVGVVGVGLATVFARDPVPVTADPRLRVAYLTSIVPSAEPVAMVERSLRAALAVRHRGVHDVWLLDEGDDEQVRQLCERLGVRHFSRRGRPLDNTVAGQFKARTKHGNYNAWVREHGAHYDVFTSVDPDHVPRPELCERMLGYFRDPEVAFVVGPQIYGNTGSLLTRWASAQLLLFHALSQRAGNRLGTATLIGTTNAIRIAALRTTGGLRDSVTEDVATSVAVHAGRNPLSGRRWRSVYVPEVLAVGEGPSSWTDYVRQQDRWARGADDLFGASAVATAGRLGLRRSLHYALLLSHYPLTAVAWLLGAATAVYYLALGAPAVPPVIWLMLFADAAVYQAVFAWWNRRLEVGPHPASSLAGSLLTTITAPVYVGALVASVLRRSTGFAVTPKATARSTDGLRAFRANLGWAGFSAVLLLVAALTGHGWWLWPWLSLAICLAPLTLRQSGTALVAASAVPDRIRISP
jgi:cellulose synthase/poly-beta-1,6-N-acetylglucosamine synthase-like glycosyltransferase